MPSPNQQVRSATLAPVFLVLTLLASMLISTNMASAASPTIALAEIGSCQGDYRTAIADAETSYSENCGQAYNGSSGLHRCSWSESGWRCQGPGTANTAPPAVSPPPPEDAASKGLLASLFKRATLATPRLVLGADDDGPALHWTGEFNVHYEVFRDGRYAGQTGSNTTFSLAREDGQEHSYTVSAVRRQTTNNAFGVPVTTTDISARSNAVVYGGSRYQPLPRAVVSMGDSFISGEGGRWLGNTSSPFGFTYGTDRGAGLKTYIDGSDANGCHRSDVAEIQSAAIPFHVPINIACSGAKTNHILRDSFKGEEPQVDQLQKITDDFNVEMVVVSIGGNDLKFGDILKDCAVDFLGHKPVCAHDRIWKQLNDEVKPLVKESVVAIRDTLNRAGDSSYRIVLQSYPSPLPRASQIQFEKGSDHKSGPRTVNGCSFYNTDLNWARDQIVPLIELFYSEIAVELDIDFLALRNSMNGREVCADGTGRADAATLGTDANAAADLEWFRWGKISAFQGGNLQEFFHPNAFAQQALGTCLRQVWDRNGKKLHNCTQGGNSPSQMRVDDLLLAVGP